MIPSAFNITVLKDDKDTFRIHCVILRGSLFHLSFFSAWRELLFLHLYEVFP